MQYKATAHTENHNNSIENSRFFESDQYMVVHCSCSTITDYRLNKVNW